MLNVCGLDTDGATADDQPFCQSALGALPFAAFHADAVTPDSVYSEVAENVQPPVVGPVISGVMFCPFCGGRLGGGADVYGVVMSMTPFAMNWPDGKLKIRSDILIYPIRATQRSLDNWQSYLDKYSFQTL